MMNGLPASLEIHKGRGIPAWFTQVLATSSATRSWWQVYLDNFFTGEVADPEGPTVNLQLQGSALRAWETEGVLTARDKEVVNSKAAVELGGVRLDGEQKLLGISAERLLKTMWATIYVMQQQAWKKREAQVLLGRWVFALQFRRAAMGCLSRSWSVLEAPWPSRHMIDTFKSEISLLLALGPLLQQDLTARYDDEVSCSDASETGGGGSSTFTWPDLVWMQLG